MTEQANTKDNRLFLATGSISDVVLNWFGESIEKLDLYSAAYHSAAKSLVANCTDVQLRDIGACPVIFLYRMSLELALKAILLSGVKFLEFEGKEFSSPKEILGCKHNLTRLVAEVKKLFRLIKWNWDEEYALAAKLIREFDTKDPGSFCFRYPVGPDGDTALERNFSFDLGTFCDRMDGVLELLDRTDCGLEGVLSQMQDNRELLEDAYGEY